MSRIARAANSPRCLRLPRCVANPPRARLSRSRGSMSRRFQNGWRPKSALRSRLLARGELLVTLREELDQSVHALLLDLLVELLLIGLDQPCAEHVDVIHTPAL